MLEIVIVEDSKEDALLAQRVLMQECKILNPITICTGGEEAIGLRKEFLRLGKPALLLLDLVMSPVSGLDVLRDWQASQYSKSSVVIMVSGLGDMKAINEGYQLGAKTFVLKPITKNDMVQILNSLHHRIIIRQGDRGYSLHWSRDESVPSNAVRKSTQVLTISA